MRYSGWVAMAVALIGGSTPVLGQPLPPPNDRPDPANFLLPPVTNGSTRSTSSRDDERPYATRPIPPSDERGESEWPSERPRKPRKVVPPSDERGDIELPSPRPPQRVKPARYTTQDDEERPLPKPRRIEPRDEEEERPLSRPRRSEPRDDDYERPLPPKPRRVDPRDEDEELPYIKPREPDPRDEDENRTPPRTKARFDFDPPPRRTPGATLAMPNDSRTIADEDVEQSRTASDRDRTRSQPTYDPIAYLTERKRAKKNKNGAEPYETLAGKDGIFKKVSDVFEPLAPKGDWFQSDHSFDSFISPVSNPFLFEDPRSLSEIRPIFLYQKVPGNEPLFNGGNIWFIGMQGRLAVTERLSVVINKFGGIGVNPGSSVSFDGDHYGLSEFWLGPKYTFYRGVDSGTIAAGGVNFQIPVGTDKVFQNTGSLSIVPYASVAQNIRFLSSDFGNFNGILGTGYSFSTNTERTDYFYLSGHLDFDVMNKHRFYPLIEMNYLLNTTDGTSKPFAFEGRDLINFGSQAKGSNLLTTAFGGRIKITKSAEFGGVFELPIAGNKDLFDYRWTIDFIWRY